MNKQNMKTSRARFFIILMLINVLFVSEIIAQNVAITDDDSYTAKPSAMLDIKSTTKGLLIPRLRSTVRNSMVDPERGLLVFDSDLNSFFYYNGSEWVKISNGQAWNVNSSYVFLTDINDKVGIGTSTPNSKLEVRADASFTENDTLFVVKDKNGYPVFAVFPDGAKVYVDQTIKGSLGGFAVSGRTSAKFSEETYLLVRPDSTRVYVNESAKGSLGGFAVSGRTAGKLDSLLKPYMEITRDSSRIYVTEGTSKGSLGGFAVSGRTSTKAGEITNDYFNITRNALAEEVDNESRIMWYPIKSAFLAGEVHVGSADSVGTNSTALGYRSIAMGNYSQAMGFQAQSLGLNSTAIGNNAISKSTNSFAFGDSAQATNFDSYAFGAGAVASGIGSYAFGSQGIDTLTLQPTSSPTIAEGNYSFAIGLGSMAKGDISISMGNNTNAEGKNSIALGSSTITIGDYSTTMGHGSQASGNYSLALGQNAIAGGYSSTAIGRDVEASAGSSTVIGWESVASGGGSTAIGSWATASGIGSLAMGNLSIASGTYSTAMGNETHAVGETSLSTGYRTYANGKYSFSIGYGASADGEASVAMGDRSIATGKISTSMGRFTTAQSYASLVIGRYNIISGTTDSWIATDPLFVVGNGTVSSSPNNALTILKNGNVGINLADPTQKLDINGQIRIRGGSPALGSILTSDADGVGSWSTLDLTNISGTLNVAKGGTGRTTLTANKLLVGNGTSAVLYPSNLHWDNTNSRLGISNTAPSYSLDVAGSGRFTTSVYLATSSGSVGVGTTSPGNFKLYVQSATGGASASSGYFLNTATDGIAQISRTNSTDGTALLIQEGTGYSLRCDGYDPNWFVAMIVKGRNVGVNTSAPTQNLDVNGNARFRSIASDAYYGVLNRKSDGTLTTATSDIRLKENIYTLDNSLNKVLQLRGVNFTWKSEPQMGTRIGFIAQEVEKIIPELVFTNDVDGYKGVNYAEMTAVLVEAIKEQQILIESLTNNNSELKSDYQILKQELDEIKEQLNLLAK
jgi:hypothetical protein